MDAIGRTGKVSTGIGDETIVERPSSADTRATGDDRPYDLSQHLDPPETMR